MQSNTAIIIREINANEESRCTTPITQQKMLRKSIKTRDVRKKGCHQKVAQGRFQSSLVIRHYVKRGHYWKESPKTVEWPTSASLEPEMFWREAKFFLHCWQGFRGQIFKNKIPFTPKCLRLKWLLRTQWSHSKISLRTMGLGREGAGSSGLGFLNLSMQNVSLTGVGWPLKNSNIFFTKTIVSGKDFVHAL